MTAELRGRRFGRLIAIAVVSSPGQRRCWECLCDCGEQLIVRTDALTTGNTQSCGCAVRENMAEIGKTNGTHRKSRTPEYMAWARAIHRCYEQKDIGFRLYGGRGIRVCDRWLNSFEAFLEDMGMKPSPAHSIDRINNNGNYEPGNCRWATRSEQNKNRRPFTRNQERPT